MNRLYTFEIYWTRFQRMAHAKNHSGQAAETIFTLVKLLKAIILWILIIY